MSGTTATEIAASTGKPGVHPQLTVDDRSSVRVQLDRCEGAGIQQENCMDEIEESQKNVFGANLACGQVVDVTLGGRTGVGALEHASEDLTPPSTWRSNRLSAAIEGKITPPYDTLPHVPDLSYDVGNRDEPGGARGRQSGEQGIGRSACSPSPLRLAFLHCVGSPYDRDAEYDENDTIGGMPDDDKDSSDGETGGMGSLGDYTIQLHHSRASSSRIVLSAASAGEPSKPRTALDVMTEYNFSVVHDRPLDFAGVGVSEQATRSPTFSGGTYIFRADGAMPTDTTTTPYLDGRSCPSGVREPVMIIPPLLRLDSAAEEEALGLEPTLYDPTGQVGRNLDLNYVFERPMGTRLAGATWNTGFEDYGAAATVEAAPPSRLSELRMDSVDGRESLGRVADVADSTFPPWGSLDPHNCWGRGSYANVGIRDKITAVGDKDVCAWRAVGNTSRDTGAKGSGIAPSRSALASARSCLDEQATVNLGGVLARSATGGMSALDVKVAAEANRPPPSAPYDREEKCANFDFRFDSGLASTFNYENLPGDGRAKAAVGEVAGGVTSAGVNNASGDTPSPLPRFQFEPAAGQASPAENGATGWNKPAASPFGLYSPHDDGRWASFAWLELGETISASGEITPPYPGTKPESAPTGRDSAGSAPEEGNFGGAITGGGSIVASGGGGGGGVDMKQCDAPDGSGGSGGVGGEVKESDTSLVAVWRHSQVNAGVDMNVASERGETPKEQGVVGAYVLPNGSSSVLDVQGHAETYRVAAVAPLLTSEPARVPGVLEARVPIVAEHVAHGSTTYDMPAESVRGTQAEAVGLNWDGTLGLDIMFPDDDEIATAGETEGATAGVGEVEVCAEVGGAVKDALCSRGAAVLGTSTTAPIRPTAGGATGSSAAGSVRRTPAEAVGLNWEGTLGLDILFSNEHEIATAGEADSGTVGVGDEQVCAEVGGGVRDPFLSRGAAVLGTRTSAPIGSTASGATGSSAAKSGRTQAEAVGLNWEGTLGLDILFPDEHEIATAGEADSGTVGVGEEEVCAEVGGAVRDALCSHCAAVLGTGTTAPIRPTAGDATGSSAVAGAESAPDVDMEDIATGRAAYGAATPADSAIAASPAVFSWFGRVYSTACGSTLPSSGLLGWASKAVTPAVASGSGAVMAGNEDAQGRKRLGAGWRTAPGVIPYRRDAGGPEEWGARGLGGASHCAYLSPL